MIVGMRMSVIIMIMVMVVGVSRFCFVLVYFLGVVGMGMPMITGAFFMSMIVGVCIFIGVVAATLEFCNFSLEVFDCSLEFRDKRLDGD